MDESRSEKRHHCGAVLLNNAFFYYGMNKMLLGIIAIIVIIGGIYLFRANKGGEVRQVGETVEASGTIFSVNGEQIAFDGPYVVTLDSEDGEVVVEIPSMGILLCPAFEAGNLLNIEDLLVGSAVEVRGNLSDTGAIVPCESEDHYLRFN